MKIRVVSNREEILGLQANESIVHLAFRPSNKDIFMLYEQCPKLQAVQLPKSYMATISESMKMFFEMQRISLLEGDVWGHRKDLNEYYTVPSKYLEVIKTVSGDVAAMSKELALKCTMNEKTAEYYTTRLLAENQ